MEKENKAKVGVIQKISNILSFIEDNISAIFLAAAILTMSYEVAARYFLNTAVYWSSEWTPYLVTWSMLIGSAILIRKNEHTSITFFNELLKKPENKRWLDVYISLASIAFCAIFVYSGYLFTKAAYINGTISVSMAATKMWIPYSMTIIAGALMVIRSAERLFHEIIALIKEEKWNKTIFPVLLLLITVGIVIFVKTCSSCLVIMAALMILFLLIGVPITFALGLSTIIAIMQFDVITVAGLTGKMWASINKYSLLAIPFFIVSGNIMAQGNLGKYLLEFASALLKKVHGGFAIAIMAAAIVFAAISGASAAAAAALGVMALPMMVEKGYPKRFGAGLIAAGGTLAIIIPPSSIMILYACTAEVSTTDMFKAGIIPGLVVSVILIVYVYIASKKNHYGEKDMDKFSFSEMRKTFKKAIWALIMPIAILGAIYGGICTATEAAAISVLYAAVVCLFIYRDIKLKQLLNIMYSSVKTSAFILAITMTASLFGFLVTMEQLPQTIMNLVFDANIGKIGALLMLNLILFLLGFFMSPGAIILIIVPMVLPITTALGISPIHLGIMLTVNLELALLTPPVGANLYVLSSISKLSVQDVIKGVAPFIAILMIALLAITFIPWLSTCLVG